MSDDHLPTPADETEPDVRLELETGGTRRSWAIYSEGQPPGIPIAPPGGAWGLGLEELLEVASRGRWHVVAWIVVLMSLGLAYLQVAPPIYHVVAQLLVVQRAELSDQQQNISGRAQFLTTQAEIISSSVVIAAALESLPPEIANAFGEDPVAAIAESLSAAPVKGTSVLALSLAAPSPEPGLALLTHVIESYRGFVQDIERTDHRQDLELLRRRDRELRSQLATLKTSYEALRAANESSTGVSNSADIQNVLVERLTTQLVDARTRRIALENELHALEEFGFSQVSGETSLSREKLREELWRAEAELAGLKAQFTDRHQGLAEVSGRVATLRAQLQKVEDLEHRTLERELGAARSTELRLDEVYRAEVAQARAIELQSRKQKQLEDEIEQIATTHRATLAGLRDAELTGQGLAEGRAQAAIHLLEPPVAPTDPAWPQPVLVLLPCAAFGVVFGLGTAWLATFQSRRSESARRNEQRRPGDAARSRERVSAGHPPEHARKLISES